MPRKAKGSDGHARDAVMRLTFNDKEYLEGIGEGDAYAGLQKLIRSHIDGLVRKVRQAPPPPAPVAKPQRYIPPPRGYVGKR